MMPHDPTDAELIESALAGSEEAFDTLMRRYERFVYKLAYGFGRSHDNALDLSQAVFLKVYRKLSLFRADSSFRTWLAKVVYNEGINWSRSNRRHAEGRTELHDVIASPEPGQDTQVLHRERLRMVLDGLSGLNRRYRAAVELRYFHGMGPREIAEILGCTEGVAKNALFRGLRSLKSQLSGA